jgi:hypothetical protein
MSRPHTGHTREAWILAGAAESESATRGLRPERSMPMSARLHQALLFGREREEMEVALAVVGDVAGAVLGRLSGAWHPDGLGRGVVEVGLRPSALKPVTYEGGEVRLYPCDPEKWIGSADQPVLSINISDAALTAACHANRGQIELRRHADITDPPVVALVSAVNAERAASFPSGRIFLDSIEQALALSLVDGYAVRRPSPAIYRGGLAPARLRKVMEFLQAKIDEDMTLEQLRIR